jgi:hypothetical protein
MPHKKIEQISGVPYCGHVRGSPFEHNPHHTAHPGLAGKTELEMEQYMREERETGRTKYAPTIQGAMTPAERRLVDRRF